MLISQLCQKRSLRVIISAASSATRSLLKTMLSGFDVVECPSTANALEHLQFTKLDIDFVILDDQNEANVDKVAQALQQSRQNTLRETKIIHLYTPTTAQVPSASGFSRRTPGVTKLTKPPRHARLLHAMISLRNLEGPIVPPPPSEIAAAVAKLAEAERTLFGNVLIAEGGLEELHKSCSHC
jgi:hypothetical protein